MRTINILRLLLVAMFLAGCSRAAEVPATEMTVPNGTKPATGWPVIVFNHGYITPEQYRTSERYVAQVDTIARNGYIVFKSDSRGQGSSEG